MKTYKGKLQSLPDNGIFVFGSNTEGRHGAGAAKIARDLFGAEYGNPKGMQGRSYAIITKDLKKASHPSISRDFIESQIKELYKYASTKPHFDFYIAYSGQGKNLNYYTPQDMADIFSCDKIPQNIIFEEEFSKLIKLSK